MAICVGCGLEIDEVTGLLKVHLKAGGGLDCTNVDGPTGGLFIASISTDTSGTIAFSGTGSSASHLSAVVRKSSSLCNGIRLDGDGVWAQAPCTVSNGDLRGYTGAIFPVGLDTVGAGFRTIQNDGGVVSVHNPTDCQIKGVWDVQAYGGRVSANPGFDAYAFLISDTNGAGFTAAVPITYFRMDNRASSGGDPNGGVVEYNINNLWERNYDILNPGDTHTYAAGVTIQVTAGTGTWYDSPQFPRFEFHWQFTPTGSC